MASIKLTGDSSGVITVSAPASAGTNTITLPASTGTMALTSNIPGAEIPSQSGNSGKFLTTNGSAASWGAVASGGMTLLSTVATTSGTSVATGTLNLTGYKQLVIDIYSVSPAAQGGYLQFTPNGGSTTYYIDSNVAAARATYAIYTHDLSSGNFSGNIQPNMPELNSSARVGNGANANQGTNTGLSTSTTSIAWSYSNGVAFDLGTIRIYGLK